jgi:hypothetical protein
MKAGVETISKGIWKPEKAINVIDIASIIRDMKRKILATNRRPDPIRSSGEVGQ